MYASTKDPELDAMMDKAMAVMAQREDGYIYTKAIIEQKNRATPNCLRIMLANTRVFDIALSANAAFKPVLTQIDNSSVMSLEGNALVVNDKNWQNQLYRPLSKTRKKSM